LLTEISIEIILSLQRSFAVLSRYRRQIAVNGGDLVNFLFDIFIQLTKDL